MAKINGRKYEVTLEDGRVVSRQYAHMLLNKEKYDERRRELRYNTPEKIKKHRDYQAEWLKKFEAENGIPYWKHRRNQKAEKRLKKEKANDNQESSISMDIDKNI